MVQPPDFPLHLGRLTVPQRWLRTVNFEEAAAATASGEGLVAEFSLEGSLAPERPTETGLRVLCFRTETYAAMEVSTRAL